jgi:hypothetical protein
MTTTELEDEKDPKRAHAVLSKGCEVVGASYSRLTGAAIKVTDRGENLGAPAGLIGLAKTTARIDKQIGLAGLATRSRKQEVLVRLPTWKARL